MLLRFLSFYRLLYTALNSLLSSPDPNPFLVP